MKRPRRRGWLIAGGILAALIVIVLVAAMIAEEPLRRYAEDLANDKLPDYRVTIGALDLHPFMLAVDLEDVVVRHQAHPEPALAVIREITADAHFWPLLTGTVAADLSLDRPVLVANRRQ